MMATYNGAKYISNQIDSICKQTYSEWNLLISDDGSSDGTIDIINSYIEKEPRIIGVLNHKSDFGASSNFYNLLEKAKEIQADYDYYFFSDQDDIWNDDKIERQVDSLGKLNGICACYSNLMVMDGDGNEVCRMSEIQNIQMNKPEDIFFNQIYIWGNTLAFNKALLNEIYIPQGEARKISHDHYIGFYASALGENIYIDDPLVRYRRYDTNVSDLPRKYNVLKIISKFRDINTLVEKHAANYAGILYFIRHLTTKNERICQVYECYQDGGIRALKIMRKLGVITGTNKWNSKAKKMILFSKIYKKKKIFIRMSNI